MLIRQFIMYNNIVKVNENNNIRFRFNDYINVMETLYFNLSGEKYVKQINIIKLLPKRSVIYISTHPKIQTAAKIKNEGIYLNDTGKYFENVFFS